MLYMGNGSRDPCPFAMQEHPVPFEVKFNDKLKNHEKKHIITYKSPAQEWRILPDFQ